MLGQRRRRLANIRTTLGENLVFAGIALVGHSDLHNNALPDLN